MKPTIIVIVFIGLIGIVAADYECTPESYAAYREHFGKNEDLTPEIYQQKYQKFCWSIQYITSLNALDNTSSHKINQFSDLLDYQNKQILNAKRPDGVGEILVEQPGRVQSSLKVGVPNWQSSASSIKNQGTCGSCWAFASTGLYESFMKIKGEQEYDLSQQFILECTNALDNTTYVSDCSGGYTDFALKVVKQYGIPLESSWPYTAGSYGSVAGTPTTPGICTVAGQNFIKYIGKQDPVSLTRYDNVTVAQMEQLLADGPVGALMYVDTAFQSYSGGVFSTCPSFANAHASINHAVVIVGMDNNKNYIIKNSWGTGWGNSGFATISKDADCALSAYVFKLSWGYQVLGSSLLFLLALMVFML